MENNIKKFRKEKGVTLQALAESCGLVKSYIHGLETGKHTPSVTNAYAISSALNAKVEDIFPDPHEYQEVVTVSRSIVKGRAENNGAE